MSIMRLLVLGTFIEIGLETEIDANIIEEEKFYVSINISIKALFSIIFDHV